MRVVAVVQARLGSVRLPGKVLRDVGEHTVISLLLERLGRATTLDAIVVATTDQPTDDDLAAAVAALGHAVVRGPEHDVLERYAMAARAHAADVVVRVTGDCPLVDPAVVDDVVRTHLDERNGYTANIDPRTFPDGIDVEVVDAAVLADAARSATTRRQREHVTPWVREEAPDIRRGAVTSARDAGWLRLTVDEPEDLEVVRAVVAALGPDTTFGWEAVLDLHAERPDLFAANAHVAANEGAAMGSGEKLWRRARRVIPGGGMLLSKRPEQYLPGGWPTYFSRASGCHVWDLDGVRYADVGPMGIGTNVLGYGHPQVDAAVAAVVAKGNLSTLMAPEEVELAERLVDLHPWADMVRLARTGGEANAVAIRVARAATGRDRVVVSGYHGWHDWYLAANLGDDDALAGQLLPGLEPAGVPRSLRGSVDTFAHGDLDALEAVLDDDVAAVKLEVARARPPDPAFLAGVRRLADRAGAVLVFDECTSGFREHLGGLHLVTGVDPDLAVFGKTLGNGYAITAVVGRAGVMDAAQDTFVSSTFWTERIGPAAALATLDVMAEVDSASRVVAVGERVRATWHEVTRRHGVPVEVHGLVSLSGFRFVVPHHDVLRTLLTQELVDRRHLAHTGVYASIAHDDDVLDRYAEALDAAMAVVAACDDEADARARLRGPVARPGFTRLT